MTLLLCLFTACEWMQPDEYRLFVAASTNDVSGVKMILASNPDVNVDEKYGSGDTALFRAVFRGNGEIVKLLLESGADPNTLSEPDKYSPLMFAARRGDIDVVVLLLDYGADVNHQQPEFGFTPLLHSLRKGHTEVAKLLVNRGADPCVMNRNRHDALGAARAYENEEFLHWCMDGNCRKCN